MGLFDRFKKSETKSETELYSEQEINELEAYIDVNFGKCEQVFHELLSPDIHVDIAIIPPHDENNFYRLVTMGMGAHSMNVPAALDTYKLNHAELMIDLPADWKIQDNDENNYWPIRWLKILARLPIESNTWLGYGHTIAAGQNHETLSENNKFEGVGLICAEDINGEEAVLKMKNKKHIHFYRMIPLYGAEMDYKQQCEDIAPLLKRFDTADRNHVVNINRKNYGLFN